MKISSWSARIFISLAAIAVVAGCSTTPVEETTTLSESERTAWGEAIRKIVKTHAREVQDCYVRQLDLNPKAQGKMRAVWNITLDGRAEDVRFEDTHPSLKPIEPCVAKRISQWKFPAPHKALDTQISYPFIFSR